MKKYRFFTNLKKYQFYQNKIYFLHYVIVIGSSQYYVARLKQGEMLSINRKNCYITQKINIRLKQLKSA